ncbi:MAG: hypothetical protein GY851_31400 [bacterium]|nr:hypothetical protein [bacterium]
MKRSGFTILALTTLALCVTAAPTRALDAGAARIEITPPLGVPLNGYYDRLGRGALSVHDPLWARCLYLEDDDTRLLIINADLCVINRELRDRVIELAPKEVPAENIILTATHTHSAQGGMDKDLLFRSVSGRFMPEVLEETAGRFAKAMRDAYAARKRATIGYGAFAQDDLSVNRREDDGAIDKQVGVIRVEDSDGNPIAIVGNFAAHPTSVGVDDALSVSADYCGFYYNELESLAGTECVAMFLNGAQGNQTCGNPEGKKGWARTESIGRLLAQRVMEASEAVTCTAADLHVGHATPKLPLAIAGTLVPSSTILHTLEIDDLLMTFFPGEPCVEIGLHMRELALARGYANQFTVGLSDDHLLYFAPRAYYPKLYYENAMSLYGPRIEDWFYTQFTMLMTKGEPVLGRQPVTPPEIEMLPGGSRIHLKGTPYAVGYQRGAAFSEAIQGVYADHVVNPCETGEYIPDRGMWTLAPSFMDLSVLALPNLGISMRPMTEGIFEPVFEEMEGMADGAGLPFDALLLTQCAPVIAARTETKDLYRAPFCTMFAATGDRAGADDILVGRNFDWAAQEPPVIVETTTDSGRRTVQVGFAWNTGTFTGMNDDGLVVCVERVEALGEPSIDGPAIEWVLREILEKYQTVDSSLLRLEKADYLRGYHVLLADANTTARVVELGRDRVVRKAEGGLLLGILPPKPPSAEDTEGAPTTPTVDASALDPAAVRYGRVAELLDDERIIAPSEIQTVLADRHETARDTEQIFGATTRCSVVFEPKARRLHVSFPLESGDAGPYTTITLTEESP